MRREYDIEALIINDRIIERLIIDPHVDKHSDHITDELIKRVIRKLNHGQYAPVKSQDGFSYFATALKLDQNWYKLVWILEDTSLYIGVITLFKDRRIK